MERAEVERLQHALHADVELGRRRGPEWYLSLGLAVIVALLLLFATTVTYVVDLGRFRQAVSRFFQVTVKPPPRLSPQTTFSAEGAALERNRLISKGDAPIFSRLPDAEADRPGLRDLPTVAMPAAAPRSKVPDRVTVPAASETVRELESGLQEGPESVPLVARRRGVPLPRVPKPNLKAVYASGREGGGGPGRPGESSAKYAPRPPPPPEPPRIEEVETPPVEAVNRARLEDVRPLVRRLIDKRPSGGYPKLDKEVQADFTVFREPGSEDTYFRLEIRLRPESRVPTLAKDVVFLVDVSQSIPPAELDAVRPGILAILRNLAPQDRWRAAVFSHETRFFAEDWNTAGSVPAREEELVEFLRRKRGDRHTNVFDATQRVLHGFARSPRPCNVFLVSDGKATSGTADVRRLVEGFTRTNRQTFSIFTFNAGEGGNRYLLQLLAYRSRGVHRGAPDLSAAGEALAAFGDLYDEPVLINTVVHYTNLAPDEVYPQVLPSLYRDTPIHIYGRSAEGKTVTMRVAGAGAEGAREFFFRTTVPPADDSQPEVARQWAQGKAHALMADLAERPDDEALRERIIRLAEKYGLQSTLELVRPKGLFERVFR